MERYCKIMQDTVKKILKKFFYFCPDDAFLQYLQKNYTNIRLLFKPFHISIISENAAVYYCLKIHFFNLPNSFF